MTIRPDLIYMTRRYAAKSTGESPAEYANPFAHYRRPAAPWRKWARRIGFVAAVIVIAAIALGAI